MSGASAAATLVGALFGSGIFCLGYWLGLRHTKQWRKVLNPPAVVTIDRFGWSTPNPQVCVGVAGRNGAQGVYSWPENDVGNAKAEMYGRGLANICGLRVVDNRSKQK